MSVIDLHYRTDRPTLIASDAEVFKLAVDLRVAHVLKPEPPYTKAHLCFECKRHFVMIASHEGYEKPEDNGLTAIVLPKMLFSKAQAEHFFGECIVETSINIATVEVTIPSKSAN